MTPRLLRARSDHVQMPLFECFRYAESYAATMAHELMHWTKHTSRLDREFGRKRWGNEGVPWKSLSPSLPREPSKGRDGFPPFRPH
jgi:hypothetical protein